MSCHVIYSSFYLLVCKAGLTIQLLAYRGRWHCRTVCVCVCVSVPVCVRERENQGSHWLEMKPLIFTAPGQNCKSLSLNDWITIRLRIVNLDWLSPKWTKYASSHLAKCSEGPLIHFFSLSLSLSHSLSSLACRNQWACGLPVAWHFELACKLIYFLNIPSGE